MNTYLQRYQDGKCEKVWAELIALGSIAEDGLVDDDAMAVTEEIMIRARYNVNCIVSYLKQSGYIFSAPESEVYVAPSYSNQEGVSALMKEVDIPSPPLPGVQMGQAPGWYHLTAPRPKCDN